VKCAAAELIGAFDLADVVEADEEGDDADNAEAAVNETPVRGYAPDWAGNESEGDDSRTGDDSELEYPLVANGSMRGPMKAMAMTRWAKASQSVP
jgi:hypothetical protein